ncbi:MAG: hypothetical protein EOO77_29910 [Oxalobacteraceae bacterium]|nr:MAG: hypothetical protein EOO77_29910 [Oxalobacteraceae bacterium]
MAFTPVEVYGQSASTIDNVEIATLFKNDQSVRENLKPEQFKDREFITRMVEGDRIRRERVRALLKEDSLSTANDFYHAAFIFQHGNTPDDYLFAHTLSLASVAKGNKDAAWIAAATLDRYLQKIGQKQIYGTQYLNSAETGPTMEPYNRALIPDALRDALGVPVQEKQDDRLAKMKASGTLTK